MNLESFTGAGSTPSRRRFWDQVADAIEASRKLAGRNVTIDEHQGAGSIISVTGKGQRGGGGGTTGACCYNDGTCDDLTESDCTDAGGNWQGFGTACDDDPNPCVGACCEGEGGTTCVDDSTPDSCAADGGTFQDFGTTCSDPDIDCTLPACCEDAFDAFDGSGRKFLTKTTVTTASFSEDSSVGCSPQALSTSNWSSTRVDTIDPDTCESSCECSGSGSLDYNTYSGGCVPFHDSASLTSGGCVGFDYCESNFGHIGYETISGCEVIGSLRPEAHGGCRGDVGSVTTVNSATSETIVYDAGSGVSFFHGTVEITLSDECTPL